MYAVYLFTTSIIFNVKFNCNQAFCLWSCFWFWSCSLLCNLNPNFFLFIYFSAYMWDWIKVRTLQCNSWFCITGECSRGRFLSTTKKRTITSKEKKVNECWFYGDNCIGKILILMISLIYFFYSHLYQYNIISFRFIFWCIFWFHFISLCFLLFDDNIFTD